MCSSWESNFTWMAEVHLMLFHCGKFGSSFSIRSRAFLKIVVLSLSYSKLSKFCSRALSGKWSMSLKPSQNGVWIKAIFMKSIFNVKYVRNCASSAYKWRTIMSIRDSVVRQRNFPEIIDIFTSMWLFIFSIKFTNS